MGLCKDYRFLFLCIIFLVFVIIFWIEKFNGINVFEILIIVMVLMLLFLFVELKIGGNSFRIKGRFIGNEFFIISEFYRCKGSYIFIS